MNLNFVQGLSGQSGLMRGVNGLFPMLKTENEKCKTAKAVLDLILHLKQKF